MTRQTPPRMCSHWQLDAPRLWRCLSFFPSQQFAFVASIVDVYFSKRTSGSIRHATPLLPFFYVIPSNPKTALGGSGPMTTIAAGLRSWRRGSRATTDELALPYGLRILFVKLEAENGYCRLRPRQHSRPIPDGPD